MNKTLKAEILFSLIVITIICVSSCKKDKTPIRTQLNACLNYGEISDLDGNKYATIKIDNQVWMAENLRTLRYSNGDTIPNIKESWLWLRLKNGAWSNYNNDPNLDALHGKLYNWYAVKDSRNICPKGWHIPNDNEWGALIIALGGSNIAGLKMKSTLDNIWATQYDGVSYNVQRTNESGFSALASGMRSIDASFLLKTYSGSFWSTTEYNGGSAYFRELFWNGNGVGRYNDNKYRGFSCRCIKD